LFYSGYVYLKGLILNDVEESAEEQKHGEAVIQLFGPYINQVNPRHIVDHLRSRNVLMQRDVEEILKISTNRSDVDAMNVLLQRIQCFKR